MCAMSDYMRKIFQVTKCMGVPSQMLFAEGLSEFVFDRTRGFDNKLKYLKSAHFVFFLACQKNWNLWNRTVYTGSDKKN